MQNLEADHRYDFLLWGSLTKLLAKPSSGTIVVSL